MGICGPAWAARLSGYEAMTLLADGSSLRTPGFPCHRPRSLPAIDRAL
jgi:hypothetical protein